MPSSTQVQGICRPGIDCSHRGSAYLHRRAKNRSRPLIEDILAHLALVFVAITVLFPVVWIVSMSLDGRNISRPTSLNIIPPESVTCCL